MLTLSTLPPMLFSTGRKVLSKVSSIDHIVKIKGSGHTPDGRPFIVLEMLKELTLVQRAKIERLWRKRVTWALNLAETFAQLHSGVTTNGHAILHRDLKPANVGFDVKNDDLKLLDFGLVCAISLNDEKPKEEKEEKEEEVVGNVGAPEKKWWGGSAKVKTENKVTAPKQQEIQEGGSEGLINSVDTKKRYATSVSMGGKMLYDLTGNTGSTRYMAPEVSLGRQYGMSCEVYSWAVLFWQLVERKQPYQGKTAETMIKSVFNEPYERNQITPELWPYGLDKLVTRAWAHDLDERPSMATIVKILRKVLEEESKNGPDKRSRAAFSCCKSAHGVASPDLTEGLL